MTKTENLGGKRAHNEGTFSFGSELMKNIFLKNVTSYKREPVCMNT